MFKKLVGYFFGWELIYSTHRVEDYARIKGKLMNAGVRCRTKCINHGDQRSGLGRFATYEIRVKKDETHKANEAIHRNM